jgi:hypothetical protein
MTGCRIPNNFVSGVVRMGSEAGIAEVVNVGVKGGVYRWPSSEVGSPGGEGVHT